MLGPLQSEMLAGKTAGKVRNDKANHADRAGGKTAGQKQDNREWDGSQK
jgi:hypothetical protein